MSAPMARANEQRQQSLLRETSNLWSKFQMRYARLALSSLHSAHTLHRCVLQDAQFRTASARPCSHNSGKSCIPPPSSWFAKSRTGVAGKGSVSRVEALWILQSQTFRDLGTTALIGSSRALSALPRRGLRSPPPCESTVRRSWYSRLSFCGGRELASKCPMMKKWRCL